MIINNSGTDALESIFILEDRDVRGMKLQVMNFTRRPSLETLRGYQAENRYIEIVFEDGSTGVATRFERDYINVVTNNVRRSWYWDRVKGLYVGCVAVMTDDVHAYMKKWIGNNHRHISLHFHGDGISVPVNMHYMRMHEDTRQVFLVDGANNHFYAGNDFIFEHMDADAQEAFNIKRMQQHATMWFEHKNHFKPGDIIQDGDIVGVVVRVYETEVDGTNYYDTDIVTGDFGLPVPVHSFNFKAKGISQ